MIPLAYPEALLLVPLAVLVLRGRLWPRPLLGTLRVLALCTAALLLAQPSWPGEDDGRDVVLVVDRSRSMPAESLAKAREFAQQLAAGMQPGDRLGVVGFGSAPLVEAVPQAPFVWPESERPIDVDGSDLAAAVAAATALVPPGRQGSLVVWSDGLHTGSDLEAAARQVVRSGLRLDALPVVRQAGADVAVADLAVPGQVGIGEPFALAATVVAANEGPAHWRLWADGQIVREGDAALVAGRNVLQFRHRFVDAGEHELAVEVTRPGDPVPQNDRGQASVRATAAPRILCVTPNGRDDRLVRSLRSAGLDVVVAAPASAPLSQKALDAFRAVVLEDVPAGDLPPGSLPALGSWVRDLGGGLLMTGGKASFGIGGYHKTPVEDVLPVTMEIREQQRRFGLAMAIALDRSGSMRADAGGVPKMQLAARGAASAIELLSPIDAVAVLAVDTAAHVVIDMQAVTDREGMAATARTIESAGGGIFVGAALHGCAEELARAVQTHKHIVLFADAADAEEPDDYRTFVPQLVKAGVTVSVIGLGMPGDSDAKLLEEIATLGNGRCQFVADAADLPRVFAQETIQVARSSMVEEPTAVDVLPALSLLGDLPTSFPMVGGYALAWARPRSETDLVTRDDQRAPLLSHWQCGLGRTAALLAEVDGPLSGGLASWDRFGDFSVTLLRWLAGGQPKGLFVEARRSGGQAIYSLEVEADRAELLDTVRGVVSAPDGRPSDLVWTRVEPGRLEARVPLGAPGVFRAAVQIGGETLRLPPVCLPYSPEYAPQLDERAGERTLRTLAKATGGQLQPGVQELWRGPRLGAGRIELGPWLAGLLLVVLLAEITLRRLRVVLPTPRWLPLWLRRDRTVGPGEAGVVQVQAAPSAAATDPAEATPAAREPSRGDGLEDALARAKRRTGRR
ncbi:MAG: VWA domain-containing protein [Planctomycetota bacterium]